MYTNRFKISFSFYFFPNTFILLAKYNAFDISFRQCLLPSHLYEPLIESITMLLNVVFSHQGIEQFYSSMVALKIVGVV